MCAQAGCEFVHESFKGRQKPHCWAGPQSLGEQLICKLEGF